GAGGSTGRPARQEPSQQAADDRATDRACARIRRRRQWGWRRSGVVWTGWRRRIIGGGRLRVDDVVGEILGDIGRRAFHRRRVGVPDAADVPPPAVTAVVDFMAPAASLPGDAAAIGLPTIVTRGDRTTGIAGIRSLSFGAGPAGRRVRRHRLRLYPFLRGRPAAGRPAPSTWWWR